MPISANSPWMNVETASDFRLKCGKILYVAVPAPENRAGTTVLTNSLSNAQNRFRCCSIPCHPCRAGSRHKCGRPLSRQSRPGDRWRIAQDLFGRQHVRGRHQTRHCQCIHGDDRNQWQTPNYRDWRACQSSRTQRGAQRNIASRWARPFRDAGPNQWWHDTHAGRHRRQHDLVVGI